ncbi:MAG TPA: hypothetical protein PL110_06770 [Candidatus Eremiobacteraeota bacterium]|nr:MAG: hypothetical protein BWY64_03664 [bacterium ADurb.Bin363]HPZ07796.1 hypothetical protein [Candidatus Eremiobacteraeota bacterium]
MRVLYYAPGGGVGHLVRGYSILRELKGNKELFMLTSSPYVHILNASAINIFKIPEERSGLKNSLIIKSIINFIKPHLLIVDTFYYGYYGELEEYLLKKSLKKIFIFRKRNDEESHPDLSCYDLIIIPNIKGDGERTSLEGKKDFIWSGYIICRTFNELKPVREALPYLRVFSSNKKIILVIHSGYPYEGERLFHMAGNVISSLKSENLIARFASLESVKDPCLAPYHINYFPLVELLTPVDIVISGCGYNTYREISMAGKKRIVTTFTRKIDEQYIRARNEKYVFTDSNSIRESILLALEDTEIPVTDHSLYEGSSVVANLIKKL